jgi:hypothetical protein
MKNERPAPTSNKPIEQQNGRTQLTKGRPFS